MHHDVTVAILRVQNARSFSRGNQLLITPNNNFCRSCELSSGFGFPTDIDFFGTRVATKHPDNFPLLEFFC